MMIRRRWLSGLISSAIATAFSPPCGIAQAPETKAAVRWHLPSEDLPTIRRYLGEPLNVATDPESQADTRGLPVLVIVSIVAMIPDIAEALVRVYRDYKFGGVVVKTKNGELLIESDRSLPSNVVVVQNEKGVEVKKLEDPSPNDLLQPLRKILSDKAR